MKKIRILSIIVFFIALVISKGYAFLESQEQNNRGPVISMPKQTIEVLCGVSDKEILAGIVAEDEEDGDVTSSLVIESMTHFIEPGRREVTIAAFDSDSNVTKVTREVIYTDYESPKFYLDAPLRFPINRTSTFLTAMSATDLLDGNITDDIKVSADYKATMDLEGDYKILFTVSNSAGDVSNLPVTVTLYDPSKASTCPTIELTDYLIYIQSGTLVEQWSYVKSVTYRGESYMPGRHSDGSYVLVQDVGDSGREPKYLTNIEIINEVDIRTPGVYEVTYRVTVGEADEQETGVVRLIVIVTE